MTTSKNKVVKILVLSLALIMLLGALSVGAIPNLISSTNTQRIQRRTYEMGQFSISTTEANLNTQGFEVVSTRTDVRRGYRIDLTRTDATVDLRNFNAPVNQRRTASTPPMRLFSQFQHLNPSPSTHSDGWYQRTYSFNVGNMRAEARVDSSFHPITIRSSHGVIVRNPSGGENRGIFDNFTVFRPAN